MNMNLERGKRAFLSLVNSVRDEDKGEFFAWCKSQCPSELDEAYFNLRTIAEDIKTLIPTDAIFSSENINYSLFMQSSGTDKEPVIHVDSFLYEDEQVDALVEDGKLRRNFCKNCGSTNVAPITFLSHSASVSRIQFIFRSMLPDLRDKVLLDIGSRLGAVLYGAYYCSSAKQIIGVEINQDLCKLQNHIIGKYRLNDRIKVISDNICNIPEVVQSAQVIVLNNVFECFMDREAQERTWCWLRSTVVPGTLLITVPSVEETLKNLGTEIEISAWLRKLPVADAETLSQMDDQDLLSDVFSYLVVG